MAFLAQSLGILFGEWEFELSLKMHHLSRLPKRPRDIRLKTRLEIGSNAVAAQGHHFHPILKHRRNGEFPGAWQ